MFLISDIIMSASQHIAGMLDRDQRTVRCYQRHRRININEPVTVTSTTLSTSSTNSSTNSTTVPMTSSTSTSNSTSTCTSSSTCLTSSASAFQWRTWRTSSTTNGTQAQGCCESKKRRTRKTRKSSWRITQRLRHLLVLLLSINYFPLISSAPTSKHNMSDRMNSHPKWINPCGAGQAYTVSVHDSTSDSVPISDKDLLNQIVLIAKLAYAEAENFREDYVQKTFNSDFQEHHDIWKTSRYDWLPSTEQIPKHLGEDAPSSHLKGLELDKSLLDTYEYLQTIAVGLEQLVWDQEDDNAPFTGKFKEIEFKLRALLCEIQMFIMERGIVMRPDVRRDIMTEAYRNNDNMTSKYLRDWLIFRDFMNALEYVIQVFNYLHDSL